MTARATNGGFARAAGWLAVSLAVSFSAAAIGGAATGTSVDSWYRDLRKPPGTPPDWVFGPVWTTLFVLMSIAAWRVAYRVRWPLALHAAQLVANATWSVLFFGLRAPGAALVDIGALWLLVATTMAAFGRHDRWAGAMFAPYLAWVSYATWLNLGVWYLNRESP